MNESTPAGWYADPSARHELRYYDRAWTEHVSDEGTMDIDPVTDVVLRAPAPTPLSPAVANPEESVPTWAPLEDELDESPWTRVQTSWPAETEPTSNEFTWPGGNDLVAQTGPASPLPKLDLPTADLTTPTFSNGSGLTDLDLRSGALSNGRAPNLPQVDADIDLDTQNDVEGDVELDAEAALGNLGDDVDIDLTEPELAVPDADLGAAPRLEAADVDLTRATSEADGPDIDLTTAAAAAAAPVAAVAAHGSLTGGLDTDVAAPQWDASPNLVAPAVSIPDVNGPSLATPNLSAPTVGVTGTDPRSAADVALDSVGGVDNENRPFALSDPENDRSFWPYVLAGMIALIVALLLIYFIARNGNDDGGGSTLLEQDGIATFPVELEQGQIVRFRARPTDRALDLVMGLGVTPQDARTGALSFAQVAQGSEMFDELFDEMPSAASEIPTETIEGLFWSYALIEPDDIERRDLIPLGSGTNGDGGDGIGEADWTVAPATGTYYIYVWEADGRAGSMELEVEAGPILDLSDEDLADLLEDEFTEGEFFEDFSYRPLLEEDDE